MYRDSRNQSRAADLKQNLHHRLCDEYLILSKRLLERYYLNITDGATSSQWVETARKIEGKCASILSRFEPIFMGTELDPSEITAPLYDAARHIASNTGLYRADLRDFIHTWRSEASLGRRLPEQAGAVATAMLIVLTEAKEEPDLEAAGAKALLSESASA